jgi:hypothetical protein
MNKHIMLTLMAVLLLTAAIPWIITSCTVEPLLPTELEFARDRYEETKEAAEQLTRTWRPTSRPPSVIPLGTVEISTTLTQTPTVFVAIQAPSATLDPSVSTTAPAEVTAEATLTAAQIVTSTKIITSPVSIVETAVPTQTATPIVRVLVVRSSPASAVGVTTVEATTMVITKSGEVSPTQQISGTGMAESVLAEPTVGPYRPPGMVNVEDVLTETMLMEQANRDIAGGPMSITSIDLTSNGFRVLGSAALLGEIRQNVETSGTFAVRDESLVVDITRILVGNVDMTKRFRATAEDSVNASLYRLLPQRYVQSYVVEDNKLVVQSLMRP